MISDFVPFRVLEIELEHPLPTISTFDEESGRHYRRALCVVRYHSCPLGIVAFSLDKGEISPQACAQQIWQTFQLSLADSRGLSHVLLRQGCLPQGLALAMRKRNQDPINSHRLLDALSPVTELSSTGLPAQEQPACKRERERFAANAPFVSVIVPTHDRPQCLATCLRSLLALQYPQYEILVVDNAPKSSATAQVVQRFSEGESRVRYIREDRPGVVSARNRGIEEARGKILAFTDDDVVVDPYWLIELVRAFSLTKNVACVTGLILPLQIETQEQFWFEEYAGFCRGFRGLVVNVVEKYPKMAFYPYKTVHIPRKTFHPHMVSSFGTGASMAFTAAFLHSIGGFNPVLSANRPIGGEDIYAFYQGLSYGYTLVYEPASLAYHLHRSDYASLERQIYYYSVSFPALLLQEAFDSPPRFFGLPTKVSRAIFILCILFSIIPRMLFLLLKTSFSKKKTLWGRDPRYYPQGLTSTELKGMLHGAFLYLINRWEIGKEGVPVLGIKDASETQGDQGLA